MINVKDVLFGAVGDGVADDAPAIQAALNVGGWVYVPAGTYRLATLPLAIGQDTRLTLDPGARLVRAAAAGMLLNGVAGQADTPGYTGRGNIIVEGGVWDAQGAVITGYSCAMLFAHAENITVRDATILNVPGYHGIEINSTKTSRITNCRFYGFTQTVDAPRWSEAIQFDGAYSSAGFADWGPYDSTRCDDAIVSGCTFGPSGDAGTTAWPRAVGSHSSDGSNPPNRHLRINILDNHMTQTTENAVRAWQWEQAIIARNHVVSPLGCGISVAGCMHVDVLDNQVFDARQNGIQVDATSQVNLRQNHVVGSGAATNNTYYGIALTGASSVENVTCNKVRKRSSGNHAKYGFYAETGTVSLIRHGNDFRSSGATASIQDSSTGPITSASDQP